MSIDYSKNFYLFQLLKKIADFTIYANLGFRSFVMSSVDCQYQQTAAKRLNIAMYVYYFVVGDFIKYET